MGFYDAIRVGASGAADSAYEVQRSLRFNDDDSTYLQRNVSSSSNRKTFTISAWVKRSNITAGLIFGQTDGSGNDMFHLVFDSNHKLYGLDYDYPTNNFQFITDQVFRDTSAWYHIVLAVDTTQSTNTDRWKLYVNGSQITSFSSATYPTQNLDTWVNDTTYPVYIGIAGWTGYKYDGYIAEYNFIDGLALTPSSFGETDVITGQWNPKKYTGTYGTNGFYLNFSDNSNNNATTLGKDSSGNGNNFTPNNFSVSAGVGNDSLTDTPTNNFCTLNPLYLNATGASISNGNLDYQSDSNYSIAAGNFALKTGKWYWEVTITSAQTGSNGQFNGIVRGTNPNGNSYVSYDTNGNVFGIGYFYNGGIAGSAPDGSTNGAFSVANGSFAGYTNNDVLGFASDIANGTLAFYKNGSLVQTVTGIGSHDWFPAVSGYGTSSKNSINFGQRAFAHTPPTGHLALSSANLPDPTILLPNKHFDTLLYTGSGNANHQITGLNFQPDWVWIKARTQAYTHLLYDSVRGVGKQIYSNTTGAEYTNLNNIYSFNNNGFSLAQSGNDDVTNKAGDNFVAWNWNSGDTDGKTYTVTVVSDSGNKYRFDGFGTSAVTLDLAEGGTYIFNYPSAHPLKFSTTADGTHGGGSEYTTGVTHNTSTQVTIVVAASAPTLYYYCSIHSGMGGQVNTNSTLGSSNFSGSIQSTVKANATAGFSIVTYTRNGSSITVGHGLGVAPNIYLRKRRDSSDNWIAYNTILDGSMDYLVLNSNGVKVDSGLTVPTSTKFYDDGSGNMVVYAFSEVAGYSKFGTYKGNNTADGPFVFTGFRPAWIMIKSTSTGGSATYSWSIVDSTRSSYNIIRAMLLANSSDSEITSNTADVDLLSNGFKPRHSPNNTNGNNTYIYLAFAEAPFKNSRAR